MNVYHRRLGSTYRPAPYERPCHECNGRGYFASDNGPAPAEFDCEVCGGTGYVEKEEGEAE